MARPFLKSLADSLRRHRLLKAGDRVGVAVSGGADSVALLRGLAALAPELGVVPVVLHLNHHLRGAESDGDEEFVRLLATQLGLESAIAGEEVSELAALIGNSLEAAGRRARYGFFLRAAVLHRLDAVATAHTADDQAETVLLRLLRGTGTTGLAGIYRRCPLAELVSRDDVPSNAAEGEAADERGPRLIRPLLDISRAEVEAYLSSLGQGFRQDSSNSSPQFLRNRVRSTLLPTLERDYNPAIRPALCELAEVAGAESVYLEEQVTASLGADFEPHSGVDLAVLRRQPLALQRRILRRLCRLHGLALDFAHLEELREFALAGRAGQLGLPSGCRAEIRKERYHPTRVFLHPASAALSGLASYCLELPIPGILPAGELLGRSGVVIRAALVGANPPELTYNCRQLLRAERVGSSLTVRPALPGDHFHPCFSGGEKKLTRLLQELAVPVSLRRSWPVVLAGERIVWVPGLAAAQDFAWQAGQGEAVAVELCSGEDVGDAAR